MTPAVGTNVLRKEGPEKLTGRALYIDDHKLPGCLFGATLRTTIPYGRLKRLVFDPAFPWKECVVVTAKDIPGKNEVALIEHDQPILVDEIVRHPMEPIALVAHKSRARAYEALKHIQAEYEPLDPVLTMEDSLAVKQAIFPPSNVFKDILIQKGDLESGFTQAEVVVEGEYRVPWQEQAYIENNGMAAWVDKDGTIVVLGSMQCPYYVHKSLAYAFGKPAEKVRVIQATTGGGFGGKEDYPSILAAHAALLAIKAKKPVKIIYDRPEDMAATTKRHPAWIKHRTGVTRHGKLVVQDVEVVMDGGAYMTLSPVVLSRGAIHAAGPYECPNVRIRARAVATNTPPNGAFRGFGAPQTLYAAELHMAKIAHTLGVDPLTLRRINVLKLGSSTATSQVLRESVGAEDVLERCVVKSGYVKRRIECAQHNRDPKSPAWKGVGLSLIYHGSGFTGAGEVMLASQAGVALDKDGRIRVLAASTEIGQGTITMFAQIAADALGLPVGWVDVETPDTSKVPNSGPTVASRTCMIVGELVRRACLDLKNDLATVVKGGVPRSEKELRRAASAVCGKAPSKEYIASYEKPREIVWDDKAYRGDAYGAFGYAAIVVEVEVDKATYEIKVDKVTSVFEIGKAVHPLLAEGQIIGGLAQGLGYSLMEDPVYRNGVMVNAQLTNYILPTSLDTPPMDIEILEKPYSHGPFGAKGLGELPMDVPGPAVAAAVFHATGRWIPELPILPEKILKAFSHDQAKG
ncbi:MAG: xanthine dehydrogenase family protein [Elusimicrobia bacterium]|nr:xanthine dehydrogenase family protein [Elusimicrobiota bacterium]